MFYHLLRDVRKFKIDGNSKCNCNFGPLPYETQFVGSLTGWCVQECCRMSVRLVVD